MPGAQKRRRILAVYLLLVAAILLLSELTAPAAEFEADALFFISDADSIDAGRDSNSVYRIGTDGRGLNRIVGSIPHGDGYLRTSDIDCDAASQQLVIASHRRDLNGFHHALLDGSMLHLDKPAAGVPLSATRQIALAPDGLRLIVSREFGGRNPPRFGLVGGDLASRAYRSVKTPSAGRSYISPDWSPDGERIAYIIERRADEEKLMYAVAIADADGGDERIVYETAWALRDLDWSPGGGWLALVMNRQIYKLRLDGGAPTRLTDHLGGATSPRWSPDGGRISYVTPSSFPGFQQIFIMNADGSAKQRIANIHGAVKIGCWL